MLVRRDSRKPIEQQVADMLGRFVFKDRRGRWWASERKPVVNEKGTEWHADGGMRRFSLDTIKGFEYQGAWQDSLFTPEEIKEVSTENEKMLKKVVAMAGSVDKACALITEIRRDNEGMRQEVDVDHAKSYNKIGKLLDAADNRIWEAKLAIQGENEYLTSQVKAEIDKARREAEEPDLPGVNEAEYEDVEDADIVADPAALTYDGDVEEVEDPEDDQDEDEEEDEEE